MGISKVVRTGANLLYPFILIFGLYVIMHGHLTPGGGFQGGAVVATGVALVIVAYSFEEVTSMTKKVGMKARESIGLLLFIGAGVAALAAGAPFFSNVLANSGLLFGQTVPAGPNPGDLNTAGLIPIMNVAVGIEVWGGLAIIVLYMLSSIPEEGS